MESYTTSSFLCIALAIWYANNAIDIVLDNCENYSYDSDFIQNEIKTIYDASKNNIIDLDVLYDLEFRAYLMDPILVKKYSNDKEKIKQLKYLANAFRYFVKQRRW